MNWQMIMNDIKELPQDKQEEVADFIAFLKSKFSIPKEKSSPSKVSKKSDNFFGMWSDRDEMDDSSSWVRNLRDQEWEKRNV
jgi:Protein of unknown function (DUF2281)